MTKHQVVIHLHEMKNMMQLGMTRTLSGRGSDEARKLQADDYAYKITACELAIAKISKDGL